MAKSLQAKFSWCAFYNPDNGPYVETYIEVTGQSCHFSKVASGKFCAAIEVTQVFYLGDSIKAFNKYNLLSPETEDTNRLVFDFTDQQRVALANGNYILELTIKDKNNPTAKPYVLKDKVKVDFYPTIVSISDIELLSEYISSNNPSKVNKNGYDLYPQVSNFYDKNQSQLKFYAEVYNTSQVLSNDAYLLNYRLETHESHQVLDSYSKMLRQTAKPVNVVLTSMDITDLNSGNYDLMMEVRNRNNELLASRSLFFQRSHTTVMSADSNFKAIEGTFVSSMTNRDSLYEYIKCLWPIASNVENNFADNRLLAADIRQLQQFVYDFWIKRNPSNPALAWYEYKKQVDLVNSEYSAGRKKGYYTERGRVYLMYGAPNQISKEYSEPTSYPYEIWQYYKLKDQTNKKFVFYTKQLASNDFELLHSDAKGEIMNINWKVELRKRTETLNDFDKVNPNNSYQNQSDQLFQNPH
ncbi:MAG: GWxTD domain-containing protein [Bacteroidota bacterium]